jgi:hypothetical protein
MKHAKGKFLHMPYFVEEPEANAPHERYKGSVINTWECELNSCVFVGYLMTISVPKINSVERHVD